MSYLPSIEVSPSKDLYSHNIFSFHHHHLFLPRHPSFTFFYKDLAVGQGLGALKIKLICFNHVEVRKHSISPVELSKKSPILGLIEEINGCISMD